VSQTPVSVGPLVDLVDSANYQQQIEFNDKEWRKSAKPSLTTWNDEKELKTMMKSQK